VRTKWCLVSKHLHTQLLFKNTFSHVVLFTEHIYYPCPFITSPVDGGWTSWDQWSTCTQSCGDGMISRERTCTNPVPVFGGLECQGQTSNYDTCNVMNCRGMFICLSFIPVLGCVLFYFTLSLHIYLLL